MHRVDKGEQPACVEACQREGHDALVFGDLNDAEDQLTKLTRASATRELRPELKLNTSVRYTRF